MAEPLRIVVNVYNLHESNRVLYNLGVGFYHTGVEVNGYEFSFSNAGVVRTRPRMPEFGEFREQIVMGTYSGAGMQGIYAIISTLRNDTFQPGVYHPTNLNCNHFSDAFCLAIVGQRLPLWINRAAQIGSSVGRNPSATAAPPGSGRADAPLAAPGVVKPPVFPLAEPAAAPKSKPASAQPPSEEQPASSIFSWFGWSGGAGTSSASTSQSTPSAGSIGTPPPVPSGGKKELTDKQKEMLAKLKK